MHYGRALNSSLLKSFNFKNGKPHVNGLDLKS